MIDRIEELKKCVINMSAELQTAISNDTKKVNYVQNTEILENIIFLSFHFDR